MATIGLFRFHFSLLLTALICCHAIAAESQRRGLSTEAADRIVSVTQSWGELGINAAVVAREQSPKPLRIKDKTYERGLGHHANGEIVLDLGGRYQSFHAAVGVQWQGGQNLASVIFRVLADDKVVFDSGIMREGDPPRSVSVSTEGVSELILAANDAGDGITCDCANWADARLVADPRAAEREPMGTFDVAPFAQVATWDPRRMTGTAAGRTEEFPAADIRLERDLLPESDGHYVVPFHDGKGCIGLKWLENRQLRQVALTLSDESPVFSGEHVELQVWSGESVWQGRWETVSVTPRQAGRCWTWDFQAKDLARAVPMLRWLFAESTRPLRVQRLSAHSRSRTVPVKIQIEAMQPSAPAPLTLEVYNGTFVSAADEDPLRRTWHTTEPLHLTLQTAVTRRYKADRTVLRIRGPETAFGVAVEDVVSHGSVHVPHAGILLTCNPPPRGSDVKQPGHSVGQGLLQRVRELPDQTFNQALERVHNPVQNNGPMMLSLACDSRKFIAEREGSVLFDSYEAFDDPERARPEQWTLTVKCGSGDGRRLTRHLSGDWLPAPTTTLSDGDIRYRQCTYVAPIDEMPPRDTPLWVRQRAVGVVEFSLTNSSTEARAASLDIALRANRAPSEPIVWEKSEQGMMACSAGRLLALIHADQASPLRVDSESGKVTVSGPLPAGASAEATVFLPAWPATRAEAPLLVESAPCFPRMQEYWNAMLAPAAQIELPDELLTNVIRASQVHCLLAARNEDAGRRVAAWISADRYGPLESEANSIIRGMGMFGHDEFARRSLDYFINRYNEAGYLTTGYTLVGTGEHLWTLAEHFGRVADRDWLSSVAPEVDRVCRWVVTQRQKTRLLDGRGDPVPECGLVPPGVSADWNRYAYRFFNDAQYCAGLAAAAGMLSHIGHPGASALQEEARQYRRDLLRAYRGAQARTPVVRLRSGAWVPGYPALLDCPGRVEEFLPGEDADRSWCYSVELGAHHLAATGILDPRSAEVGWMMDYLEEEQFLRSGMGDYPESRNREDEFNLGGFSKVQPYYGRFAEIHALRDDVKPFVRAYFNALASLLSLETLSLWEHFHNIAGWNKTHETGWFLCQSRMMLVMERGDELWLAPFAPSAWFEDGRQIALRGAPTDFGRVRFQIHSNVAQNRIDAAIDPPTRSRPARIVLRLRHPEAKPIRSVLVDGKAHDLFDPIAETVTLPPGNKTLRIEVRY